MDAFNFWQQYFDFNEGTQQILLRTGLTFFIFLFLIILSIPIGRYTPSLVKLIIKRAFPKNGSSIYRNLIAPLEKSLKIVGTLILISASLPLIENYEGIYKLLNFFLDLSLIISIAYSCSQLFRQFVRVYGINLIRKLGLEVDELLLVVETIANIIIGFIAALAFAQSQNVNLVGLLAGLGIGGIAIAFAAQKTLEQLLGTLVLYLDRPYVVGEYIRVNFNPHAEDTFARVESIGLRSTKLRVAATSTLIIVPNSIMSTKDIENVTRGKKVMVLLYLDFSKLLEKNEEALVEKVIQESTDNLFGIDPGSTKIYLFQPENQNQTRARITFFILGSSEDSIQLRKRLLELANEQISQKLVNVGIEFTLQEPTIYVESPMTI